jgi:hypothetical protein
MCKAIFYLPLELLSLLLDDLIMIMIIIIIIIIIFSSNICGVISLLILYMTLIVNLRLLHPSSLVIEQGIASSF